jgi:hypothetical protein
MPGRLRGGRLLRRALWGMFLASTIASAQTTQKAVAKKTGAHRANELTLAGLRPGRDSAERAISLYREPSNPKEERDAQLQWVKTCETQTLTLDLDANKKIQVIRTTELAWLLGDCAHLSPGPWRTGLGLRVGDAVGKVAQLYGEPDSKSPSTRDGQPLELWYYAFDWAGPDVPQVMEVLCTRGKEGQPGKVVEITLAAPSL